MKRSYLKRSSKPLKRSPMKRKPPKVAKPPKKRATGRIKPIKTSTADTSFSIFIRQRDGKCLRCGITESLTCSHFWPRGHSGTRFDPKNCITLCQGPYSNRCHDEWEIRKNQEYKDFMLNWLGQEEYDALEKRARTFKKREEAVAEWKATLSSLRKAI